MTEYTDDTEYLLSSPENAKRLKESINQIKHIQTIQPEDYTIIIQKGIFGGEYCFESRVLEFPWLADYADTYNEAYELILDSIVGTIEMFNERNKEIPIPFVNERMTKI